MRLWQSNVPAWMAASANGQGVSGVAYVPRHQCGNFRTGQGKVESPRKYWGPSHGRMCILSVIINVFGCVTPKFLAFHSAAASACNVTHGSTAQFPGQGNWEAQFDLQHRLIAVDGFWCGDIGMQAEVFDFWARLSPHANVHVYAGVAMCSKCAYASLPSSFRLVNVPSGKPVCSIRPAPACAVE